jgi:hypothetical protein
MLLNLSIGKLWDISMGGDTSDNKVQDTVGRNGSNIWGGGGSSAINIWGGGGGWESISTNNNLASNDGKFTLS